MTSSDIDILDPIKVLFVLLQKYRQDFLVQESHLHLD